ncbi:M16 family metallopeptidase [Schlesneria sp. DSM 10557]|uniref:M16 family metallopeptidase n=1 Tax=Schlesneria sp. DSM 10557 TaxID=3044399 RepID=UPI0035A0D3F0
MAFHHLTLDNGLEVVAETNSAVHSVAFGFYVKAGARDETPEVSGVSHFLEHMAFKGTERFSAEDVNRIFDELGADNNAATGEESTVYYAATLPEYLPQAFEIQSSILFPTLRQDDFDMEKKVILEEIGMYADQPSSVAYDNAMQTHFRGHPLGKSILGTTESVSDLTSDQMRKYHRDHYLAGNIVLAVTGNTDWNSVVELAHRHCAHWPQGKSSRPVVAANPRPSTRFIPKADCQQEQIIQLSPAPSGSDPLRFAAELMAVIVGDDCNSRLYWELLDPGLVESAELGYYEYEDTGAYLTFLNGPPEETEANLERIARIYADVNRNGITADELEQAKNKVCSRLVLRGERPMGRLGGLGNNWLFRREYRSIADDVHIVQSLQLSDIRKLLDQYPLGQMTTIGVGPLEGL